MKNMAQPRKKRSNLHNPQAGNLQSPKQRLKQLLDALHDSLTKKTCQDQKSLMQKTTPYACQVCQLEMRKNQHYSLNWRTGRKPKKLSAILKLQTKL